MNPINQILNNLFIEPISRQVSSELRREQKEILSKQNQELKKEPLQWDIPMTFKMQSGGKNVKKPGASIDWLTLRQFAEYYPIARACINYLKTQITKLQWDIGAASGDKNVKGQESNINKIKKYFKTPSGHKTRLRELLSIIVEDVTVLDAISLYKRQTYGGDFLHLIPIDPGTIKLKVNEFGGTPEPPEIAYEQWILGEKKAEMTTNELIYEMLSPRSDNAYGRAPLESLIIEVESALQGALYNLKYLEEGNDPEGFGVLPEGWTLAQVKEWQDYWDALMSGNMMMRRRMRWVPNGFEFVASKKAEDMAFEKFELWLLQKTCAVFGVAPQAIGFTYQVNKSTGEVQEQIGQGRGLYPIANFIKEIFDDIIQQDLGFTELAWVWTDIDPIDEEREAKVFETLVRTGAMSVDEYRRGKGLEEIGLRHYIMTAGGPVMVDQIVSGEYQDQQAQAKKPADEEKDQQKEDLKRWMNCALADLKKNRPFRKFQTTVISDDIYGEIEKYLAEKISGPWQIKKIFRPFLTQDAEMVTKVVKLHDELEEIINSRTEEN